MFYVTALKFLSFQSVTYNYLLIQKTLIDSRGWARLGHVLADRKNKKKLPQTVPKWDLICAIKMKIHQQKYV